MITIKVSYLSLTIVPRMHGSPTVHISIIPYDISLLPVMVYDIFVGLLVLLFQVVLHAYMIPHVTKVY